MKDKIELQHTGKRWKIETERKDRTDKESQEEVERQKTISNKTQDKKCKIPNNKIAEEK